MTCAGCLRYVPLRYTESKDLVTKLMEEFKMRKLFFVSFLTLSVFVAPAIVNAQETAFDSIKDENFKKCLVEKYGSFSNTPEKIQLLSCSNGQFTRDIKKIVSIEGIEIFTNLIYIDFSRNQIKEIPATIGSLVNLTTIDLSNNEITTIPSEMKTLVDLKTLDLSNNEINDAPDSIVTILGGKKLKGLDLSGNNISITSVETENMKKKMGLNYLSFLN